MWTLATSLGKQDKLSLKSALPATLIRVTIAGYAHSVFRAVGYPPCSFFAGEISLDKLLSLSGNSDLVRHLKDFQHKLQKKTIPLMMCMGAQLEQNVFMSDL